MIRVADHSDIETLVALGQSMHSESEYRSLPYIPEKFAATLAHYIENEIVFIAERDGQVVGGLVGGAAEYHFCHELYGYELAVFVLPEHRGSLAAFAMLRAFEGWCKARGVKRIDLGITTGVHEEQTARFYGKMGYNKCGSLYRKEVGNV